MHSRRGSLAALLALAIVLAPGAALADGKAQAQQLLTKGNELVGDGDYLSALETFRAAYAAFPSPKILLNIGTTLRQLGRNAEAAKVFEAYLVDPAADQGRLADVHRVLAEIDTLVGHLRIDVNVPDSRVLLDGTPIEAFQPGMTLRVEPGQHTVVGEHAGLAPSIEPVKLGPNQSFAVKLVLLPPEVKARIVVKEVTRPASRTQHDAGLVIGLAGAAGIGVGSVFGLLAKSNDNQADLHCVGGTVCDKTGVGLGSDAKTDATVSTVAFAVGGVAVATSVVLLLTAPTRKPTRADVPLRIEAGPTLGGGALHLHGSFY